MQRIGKHKAVTPTGRIIDTGGRVVEQDDLALGGVHGAGRGLFPKVGQVSEVRDATPDENASGGH